jgi:hAT family C-terminal dimerisation region
MIKRVSEKQREWGMGSPLGLACQKAFDKLNEYYNGVQAHAHSSIATICDPQFNFNVFNILMPNSTDNAKRAKIKSGFKTAFFQYQDREAGIKAARILKEKEDALETQLDDDDDDRELSDAELYRSGPLELDTETELTRYLKLPLMPRETNIYSFWKAKQFEFPIISKIAGDFLAIPATSAPSECVFSVGSDIVTKKRNRLTGDSVRMIMCLKD